MREILFRGKDTNGDWHEGYLVSWENWHEFTSHWSKHFGIVSDNWCNMKPNYCIDVIPQTIGQFTGLTDKNGVKVFEGDIIHMKFDYIITKEDYIFEENMSFEEIGVINFKFGCFILSNNKIELTLSNTEEVLFEVFGNIHDNPELLNNKN